MSEWALTFGALLFAYSPALSGTLLWDDAGHITRPDLRSIDGLWRIWFDIGATQQYYPVLHSAFWLEHRVWGDAVAGYHLANILLHSLSAFLLILILRRLAVRGALVAGLIFRRSGLLMCIRSATRSLRITFNISRRLASSSRLRTPWPVTEVLPAS